MTPLIAFNMHKIWAANTNTLAAALTAEKCHNHIYSEPRAKYSEYFSLHANMQNTQSTIETTLKTLKNIENT